MKTKNNIQVKDRYNSHLHKGVKKLLPELLSKYEVTEDFRIITHDFGKVVGRSYCVETRPTDRITFMKRPNRQGRTRFVLNRKPEFCNFVTIMLSKKEDGYIILTAFVGKRSEPEIWDERAFEKDERGYNAAKVASNEFWSTHALIKE